MNKNYSVELPTPFVQDIGSPSRTINFCVEPVYGSEERSIGTMIRASRTRRRSGLPDERYLRRTKAWKSYAANPNHNNKCHEQNS